MPNQPKTPLHSFRVDDELWEQVLRAARANGQTIADVLRAALRDYLDRHPAIGQPAPRSDGTPSDSGARATAGATTRRAAVSQPRSEAP